MKTLENQTLLYDEDCPLCQAYTSGFIKVGMLDKNGKKPYTKIAEEEAAFIDTERAANEIALIDTKNKTAVYGIDSLLKIIGNSFPIIATIGKIKPVNYLLRKLYSFISYNRKVIIPSAANEAAKLKCEPTFNVKYRILYLLFAIALTTITLYNCAKLIPQLPNSSYTRELILATCQILFQGIFLIGFDKKTVLNYFGNLMTVSLFGCVLLAPIIIASKLIEINAIIVLIWFGITVLIILKEHYRRVSLLKLPKFLTLTWILYRVIALLLILNF
jgi:DCC1-like thiol-disulfide oxidoreductase